MLKLDLVQTFGKPQSFLDAFETGPQKILNYICSLHATITKMKEEQGSQARSDFLQVQRKKSDPHFDSDEYVAALTQKMEKDVAAATKVKPKPARKYSETKYDLPEYQSKIEQQTLAMISAITGDKSINPAPTPSSEPDEEAMVQSLLKNLKP